MVASTPPSRGRGPHPNRDLQVPSSRVTSRADGTAVWILAGELDVSSTDMVVRDGLDAIQQTSTGVLVADLSGVTFLDSYAIEAFDTVRVAARMHSRALKIVGVHPRIYRVFSLVGLARTFGLSDPTGSAR